MLVRPATAEDRFAILRMGKAFVASIGSLPFQAAYAERTVLAYIVHADRLCAVLDDDGVHGFIMAHACDHPFLPARVAQELAWWVAPEHRGHGRLLLDAYEAWAAEQRCGLVEVAHVGDPRLTRFYQRRGYRVAETHFVKII